MILTLEITGPREGTPWGENRKVFRATGGTIGRLPDNDLVLPDPYVSNRHARIRYANGVFHLEDTSTNGVFINSSDNRLVRGQPYVLKSGDRILIDPFEIQASIAAEQAEVAEDPFTFSDFRPPAPAAKPFPQPVQPQGLSGDLGLSSSGEVDPLRALGLEERSAPPVPRAADLRGGSLLEESYKPPRVPVSPSPAPAEDPAGLIPADWDLSSSDLRIALPPSVPSARSAPPARTVPPVRPPAEPPAAKSQARSVSSAKAASKAPAEESSDVSLGEVLAGAGIDAALVTPELAQNLGRILRVVVAGVIDILQARTRLKDEFRMRMTTFRPAQNNPLKFSADADDALHNLLVKRSAAYLGPVEAFEDAFDDVRNHQMAMLAGVRVAFEAMLSEFNPDRLQEEFDRQAKGSLLSVPGKLRYWDQYRNKFSDMVSDADASFRELFGHEFARAYEEQLERLKAQDKARTP